MDHCDQRCAYAYFPETDDVDVSRSCRTFGALNCRKKKALVRKNLPCPDRRERMSILTGRGGVV
jgi:hypothetical protein